MVFGLLAVLVAVVAVSTIAMPTFASSVGDTGNSTTSGLPDATPIQDPVRNATRTRQRLGLCDQTGVCAENCTQTQARIRAMDGSCGLDGAYTGDGSQYRGGASAQAWVGVGSQTCSRGRNQSGACIAAQTGTG